MTLCLLVIFSNVLDPRTYRYQGQGGKDAKEIDQDVREKMDVFDLNDMDALDRRRCAFFRGLAWQIISWIEINFKIVDTTNNSKLDFVTDIL